MRDESGRRGPAAGPARALPPGPGAGATTRRQRRARLRHSLWQPPRAHGEQSRERVVGSLVLFYHLTTVAGVAAVMGCRWFCLPRRGAPFVVHRGLQPL